MKAPRILALTMLAAAATLAVSALTGCSSFEHRDPTGDVFPSVVGTSLDDEEVRLPEDFAGAPVLLLVGYEQRTQFDLDRWLLGLAQAETDVVVREVPTIPNMIAGMFSGSIDGGMRRGIPSEDWFSVVTLYGDASDVARFTGNEDGMPGRILLLDDAGRVVFFHDRGYSVGSLMALNAALEGLQDG